VILLSKVYQSTTSIEYLNYHARETNVESIYVKLNVPQKQRTRKKGRKKTTNQSKNLSAKEIAVQKLNQIRAPEKKIWYLNPVLGDGISIKWWWDKNFEQQHT